jgi:hypothetical protein
VDVSRTRSAMTNGIDYSRVTERLPVEIVNTSPEAIDLDASNAV